MVSLDVLLTMCSLHDLLCSEVTTVGVSTEEVYLTHLDSRNTDGHTTITDKIAVLTRLMYRTVEEMVGLDTSFVPTFEIEEFLLRHSS